MIRRHLAVDDTLRTMSVSALVVAGIACANVRAHADMTQERPGRLECTVRPTRTHGILTSTSSFKSARTSGPSSPSAEASGGDGRGSS